MNSEGHGSVRPQLFATASFDHTCKAGPSGQVGRESQGFTWEEVTEKACAVSICFMATHLVADDYISIFGGKPPILNQPCFINPGLTLENIHLGTFCGGL